MLDRESDKNSKFILNLERHKSSFLIKLKNDEKSKHTISAYESNLKFFFKFLVQYDFEIDFETLREVDIYEYINFREILINDKINLPTKEYQKIATSTKNQIVSNLKNFFSFIERNNRTRNAYDFSSVFKEIKISKPKREPKGLSSIDNDKFVDFLNTYANVLDSEKGILENNRNVLLAKIIIFSGVRISEALGIKLNDFQDSSKDELYLVNVIGKGTKERKIYIEKDLINKELNFIKNHANYGTGSYIAMSKNLKRMSRFSLYKAINVLYRKCGINETTVHGLRHTYAKNKIKVLPITVLQKLLGHSDISTTTVYTDPTDEIIEDALIKSISK